MHESDKPAQASGIVIYACSGCSDAGELADRTARTLSQQKRGEMSCLAGVGGRVKSQVSDPRIHPLDVRAIQDLLAVAYHRVCDAAIQAYRANEVIYLNFALREFMEAVEKRWPNSGELPVSMDVAETASNSAVLFEKARSEKLPQN